MVKPEKYEIKKKIKRAEDEPGKGLHTSYMHVNDLIFFGHAGALKGLK